MLSKFQSGISSATFSFAFNVLRNEIPILTFTVAVEVFLNCINTPVFFTGVALIGFVVLQLCALPGYVCFNGGIEHSVEVYRIGGAIVPPTAYTAIATNFGIGNDLYFRTNKLLCFAAIRHGLLAQKETRVDLQRTVAFRIRKAIEAYSSRRGYFRADVIPGEYGLIIAELNLLVFTIGRLVELIEATRKWHDQYVAILGPPPVPLTCTWAKPVTGVGSGSQPLLGLALQSGLGLTMPNG